MNRLNNEGMTLMEILVTFALIAILATLAILLIKPEEQFAKAKDTRRKHDLNELRKVMESYLGDKGCYPKTTEICYNPNGTAYCNICTSNPSSPSLNAYSSAVTCDPDSPIRDYLYEAQGDVNCPNAYIIYSKLTSTYNAENDIYNCSPYHGCGPGPSYGYDYLVTSPNAAISITSNYFCYTPSNRCSSCGTYTSCIDATNRGVCITVYSSSSSCCNDHPGAGNCT